MSLLSERVQKSKALEFKSIGPSGVFYGTTSHNHEHHYQIRLAKFRDVSQFGDLQLAYDTITVECTQCHQPVQDCKGNSNGTVCYHGLGAIRHHMAIKNYQVAFCNDIFDAIKLRKNGEMLARVVSTQGDGRLWAVVSKKKAITIDRTAIINKVAAVNTEVSDFMKRVELLRGPIEEEVID